MWVNVEQKGDSQTHTHTYGNRMRETTTTIADQKGKKRHWS